MADLSYNSTLAQAKHHVQTGQWKLAQQSCAALLNQRHDDPAVLSLMAQTALATMNLPEAIKCYQRCVDLAPRNLQFHLDLGTTLIRAGHFKQAVWCFENAQSLFPNNSEPALGLAEAHQKSGNPQKARSVLQLYLNAGTESPEMAHIGADIELDAGNPHEAVRLLERHNPTPSTQPGRFFTLGRAYEKLDLIDKAWNAYTEGNRRTPHAFDLNGQVNQLKLLLKYFNRDSLAAAKRASDRTIKPIFLVGRPRSGTTLIQTILGAHPQVTTLGETTWLLEVINAIPAETGVTHGFPQSVTILNQTGLNRLAQRFAKLVRAAAPLAETVVDKSLYNYKFLGLVQLLFPHAKIVYCKRDTLDVCFAAYSEDLRTHPYTTDLQRIGVMHRLFERMMDHWKTSLDLPILEVDYETLVTNQEPTTRTLAEFCGLDWTDKLLNYTNPDENPDAQDATTSPTLSFNQVRKPVYSSSVSRAKKFEKYLAPLHEGFAEADRLIAQHGL